MDNKRRMSFTIFLLVMIFFYLPLMVLIIYSFNDGKSSKWIGFSFKWYKELFLYSDNLWKAFENSIIIAFASSLVSTIIGTLGAIGITWYSFVYKRYIKVVSYLPIIIPEIVIGISLLIFFANLHWNLSLVTIFIAHTTFNIPFVLFIIMSRLDEFDYSIIEAAYDLGATELYALTRVIIPMSIPGIVSGFLMAMTLSMDDFVITFFVAGPGSSTLPLHIYSMIRMGVSPVINAISVVLIAGTFILAMSSRNIQKYMFKN
jgi:spermidine/putrescine transport system permease protein